MTPKEKAANLVSTFYGKLHESNSTMRNIAKQCALIVVDEILNALSEAIEIGRCRDTKHELKIIQLPHWVKVKEEINKL